MSFRREKYVPKGGPDGGDGGKGGDVVIVADPELRDLSAFAARRRYAAGQGGHGEGSNRHGADGESITLHVPVGTQVFDAEARLVADLARSGASAPVARGGLGGAGNRRFASSTHQAPRLAEVGQSGESAELELRLKLFADAALLGFPNAGKSSLLRRLSNAKPKVAGYPFTTLEPVLGTAEAPDGTQLTIADVPGLVEGASEGVGLGHEFLMHLERARFFLHVIDATEDVAERFAAVDRELVAYGEGLADRPQIVVLNKIDLAGSPSFAARDERILAVHRVSALTGVGIPELTSTLFELAAALPDSPPGEPVLADYLVYRPKPRRHRQFRILRGDRGFRVSGPGVAAVSEAELRAALRAAGARPGDPVTVGDRSFEL